MGVQIRALASEPTPVGSLTRLYDRQISPREVACMVDLPKKFTLITVHIGVEINLFHLDGISS